MPLILMINEIEAKHILTKSKLPGLGYSINPYVGCQHACVYCYARFMKRFTNHEESWETFVNVKINTIALFEKDFKKTTGLIFGLMYWKPWHLVHEAIHNFQPL